MKRTALVLLGLLVGIAHAGPVAKKDLDGDGKADVVWRSAATGENYLYPMNGTQILASEGYLRAVPDQAWGLAGTGDFDGDGKADLLWRHGGTGENYVYFMNGTQITGEGYLRTVADLAWKVAGVGDFDGDQRDDILWRNSTTGENYLYPMDGLTIKPTEGYLRTVTGQAWQVAGVGDTDGDGNADIVWRNVTNGQNYLYPMSGTSILGTEGFLRTVADLGWKVAGIGDFDGDGHADLLWRHSGTGQNYLYPLNGTQILAGEGYLRTVADLAWRVHMTADFNGDGTADIFWRNIATGENYLYLMAGTTVSAEGYTRSVVEPGWQVAPPASGVPPTWGAQAIVSNQRSFLSYEFFTPSIALTSRHVGFVAWNEEGGTCGRIWVNRNAGGAWDTAGGTEVGTTQALSPYVAANANGDAIVVWVERQWDSINCGGGINGNEVWGNFYSASSGTWSGPFRISVDAPTDYTVYAFSPAATLDDSGRAMVVWIQDGLSPHRNIWYSRFDGAWSDPALLTDTPGNTYEPTLRLDGAGNVLAAWVQDTNAYDPSQVGGGPILPNVWSARFDATAAAWSTPARIGSPDLSGFEGTERPRLAVNASGNAVAIWQESRTGSGISSIVGARFLAASGTWTAPVPLEANAQQAYWPEVAIDAAGNAQAVWVQRIDGSEANESGYTARMYAATGEWSTPVLFEQSTNLVSNPKVGMDAGGRAIIAWNQILPGGPPVHAVHYTPATGFGPMTSFPGEGLVLAVNPAGAALLASDLTVPQSTTFLETIRAAMLQP